MIVFGHFDSLNMTAGKIIIYNLVTTVSENFFFIQNIC